MKRILAGWCLLLLTVSAGHVSAQPSDVPLVELPNSVPGVLARATLMAVRAGAGDEPITLTLVLQYTDRAGFDAFIDSINREPVQARSLLSPAEIADRFGPSQESYDRALAYMRSYGFSLTEGSVNRLTLTFAGTRAQAEQAFNVAIRDYRLGDRVFYANTTNPRVPSDIADRIEAVVGLSNLSRPGPRTAEAPDDPTSEGPLSTETDEQ